VLECLGCGRGAGVVRRVGQSAGSLAELPAVRSVCEDVPQGPRSAGSVASNSLGPGWITQAISFPILGVSVARSKLTPQWQTVEHDALDEPSPSGSSSGAARRRSRGSLEGRAPHSTCGREPMWKGEPRVLRIRARERARAATHSVHGCDPRSRPLFQCNYACNNYGIGSK
jgi:hypothetical protein